MQQTKEKLFLDRYEVIEELGSGGFSKVYKAFDTKMERHVAIKAIPASSKATTWAKREAQTSAHLNHPGIATIYEYDEIDNNHYLIMEYLEGITLRDVLNKVNTLEPYQAVAIISELAIALEYAHINFVIHRDIKPENIMILSDGRVKITDFGTARLMSEVSNDHKTVATPSYMSPEQAKGERDDDRTDQFSLAIVLYEMLTGENPFDAGSTSSTLFNITNKTPLMPSQFNKNISNKMDLVCFKALDKNPEMRFATVTDFRYKIKRAVDEDFTNKQVIKELYNSLQNEADSEKAFPDFISSSRRIMEWFFKNEKLSIRIITGLLPALFIITNTTNISLQDKTLIASGLLLAGLISPFISIALFATLLIIKSFFSSPFLGLIALMLGVPYLYLFALKKPFESVFPLISFIFAKLGAVFLFPLFAGLFFGPLTAMLSTALGITALGFSQLAAGKNVLFVSGNNYWPLILQSLLLIAVSGTVSVFSRGRNYLGDIVVIISGLLAIIVAYILPHWSLLSLKVNYHYVMQNASLSLIIAIALVLLVPYQNLKEVIHKVDVKNIKKNDCKK